MNTRRLIKLAAFLRGVPRRVYDQDSWGNRLHTPTKTQGFHCDTPGCALGWAAVRFPWLFTTTHIPGVSTHLITAVDKYGRECHGSYAGAAVFDLDHSTATELFGTTQITNVRTPKQAARKIMNLVKAELTRAGKAR